MAGDTTAGRAAGADADSPWGIPAAGWKAVLLRAWNEAGEDNIGLIAAGVAFYAFLSIVPLLGAVVMLYGLVADTATVGANVAALTEVMPREVARLIGEQLLQVVTTSGGAKGFGLVIALALALYGAMSGAGAIVTALNIAYEEHEDRGFIRVKLVALAVTLGAVVLVLAAMTTVAAVALLDDLLPGVPGFVRGAIRLTSYLVLAGLAAAGAASLYRFGPDRAHARWVWLTPGSVGATLIWLAMTTGFGLYVANFGNYDATYGSLGAIVVMLTWLSLSAYVFLLGAELNAELERQTGRDTTTGPPRPRGNRHAAVADAPAGGVSLPRERAPVVAKRTGGGTLLPALVAAAGLALLRKGRGWGIAVVGLALVAGRRR
ncbi:YihY/virulence factor BrkB family protein [Sphingomonas sp. KR1UV-12]|uniref:YihY/virulence factor BrkB family protein n=1 Tax=Sphingomonas aurea TaxID=3063994 RepID=A0ABT9EK00_9SPHN|nr:YihY/virulence factor BrkB family protein [Sphingomonas sp. KR1UV-12]MDP1027269.1 YihY/virulence factor BrkB family protein [Sphingomonas sp. KR1UV-12]